ncbi:hypothetical protein F383_17853 [Gossypium arboreum]|uniref:Uncharacterized protein n=1 Tax=Gossypium arboreum TaxID=29729 RepID=A0A0B0NJN4_GOSAR|nr:hypothetical protein F383_17853 [Gossypium arboreum]
MGNPLISNIRRI